MELGHELVIAGAVAFVVLSLGLMGGAFDAIDLSVHDDVAARRATPDGHSLFGEVLSAPGSPIVAWVAAFGAMALASRGRAESRVWVPFTFMLILEVAVQVLKWGFGVERPSDAFSGDAFPSGHATRSVLAWGMLAAMLAARPTRGARLLRGKSAAALVFIAALAVGVGRIILGVHWVSDVLAGWALGTLLLGAALVALPRHSESDDEGFVSAVWP